ncbi:hypothetical protein SH1V18_00450 [Vallitalea longa]|uniref:F5/8 type C domain-containing protein n=1 Tax=Vallitalea longa TaxID=2936439 RepID=A0A9W5Y706_9FIRM|nr:glycoside hydrolase family 98 domain-containing protein [Vallitalea longa]GKX27565.1 hypothetical protein SH1V18_00450 [Vallitalea longa]
MKKITKRIMCVFFTLIFIASNINVYATEDSNDILISTDEDEKMSNGRPLVWRNFALDGKVSLHSNKLNSDRPASMANDGIVIDSNKMTSFENYAELGSTSSPATGTEEELPDGAEDKDKYYLQLELEEQVSIEKIKLYRYWGVDIRYHDTVILASEDEEFTEEDVIWNADENNIYGFGNGSEWDYIESKDGYEFVFEPRQVKHIRVYSSGKSGYNGVLNNNMIEKGSVAWAYGLHCVEIEAYGKELAPEKPVYNAENYLNIPTFTANGKNEGEVTHPDIIKFDTSWNGYKYWMAVTPNQTGNSQFENPCIVASNDGENWVVPKDIENPLTGIKEEPRPYHNCDVDLVYDEDSDSLRVYYVWSKDDIPYGQDGFQPSEVRLIEVKKSDEGYSVSSPETVVISDKRYDILSPSIVKKSDDEWYMWCVNTGDRGYNNQTNHVDYRTSSDGKNWSMPVSLKDTFIQRGYQPWHIDVEYVEEKDEYFTIFPAYPDGGNSEFTELFFARSNDGITWTNYENPMLRVDRDSWDSDFIYRSTFIIENDTMRIWYSAGTGEGWRIGYTANNIDNIINELGESYQGEVEPEELRIEINNENPLFLHHLYRVISNAEGLNGPLQGGNSIQGFWNAIVGGDENGNALREDLRDNQAIIIHASGNVKANKSTLDWYEETCEKTLMNTPEDITDDAPFFIMVSNSGTSGGGKYEPPSIEWTHKMYEEYPNMIGVFFSENHNATSSWEREARSLYMARQLELAAMYGGHVVYSDMNDNNDYIQSVIDNEILYDALEKYNDNFVLIAKTTSAWDPDDYNSDESVVQGAWLAEAAGNWGSLIDSWMWFIENFGPLYGNDTFSVWKGVEECRGPVTFPELFYPMRMIQQARVGATVFTFEHPYYSTSVKDQFTPTFTAAIAKAMEYMVDYNIPTREEVIENTKVAYSANPYSLRKLSQNQLNPLDYLYGDSNNNGYSDTTMMTYFTGRYGTLPTIPKLAKPEILEKFENVIDYNYVTNELKNSDGIVNYFNEKYEENYTGDAYVSNKDDVWFAYNNNWNIDSRLDSELDSKQSAAFKLQNKINANIEFSPYSYFVIDSQDLTHVKVQHNNFLVDKNDIWVGYDVDTTSHWDSDHDTQMDEYLLNEFIPDDVRKDDRYRSSKLVLKGLNSEPVIRILDGMTNDDGSKQYDNITSEWNEEEKEFTINISSNGWVDFVIDIDDANEIKELSENWEIVRENSNLWKFAQDGSDKISIKQTAGCHWNNFEPKGNNLFITEPNAQDNENYSVTVKMTGVTTTGYEQAGLLIYKDDDNFVQIARMHKMGNPLIAMNTRSNGDNVEDVKPEKAGYTNATIYLKLLKNNDNYTGYYSEDGQNWVEVANVDNATLDNARIGLFASTEDVDDWFEFEEFKVDNRLISFTEEP